MAQEEKLDIEDIKDPEEEVVEAEEEMDLEEVVSDEPEEPIKEIAETKTESAKKEKKKRKLFGRKSKEKKSEEKPIEKEESDKAETPQETAPKKKSGLKTFLAVILTMLMTAAVVLGAVYWWLNREKAVENTPVPAVKEEKATEIPEQAEKAIYVSSEIGLNLRKEPSKTAEVLAIIPFGTKITVLDENTEWYKTEYENKEGWVIKEFTTTENPLVYTNSTYGFTMTFPSAWAGYKLFPVKELWEGVTASYYVGIPTTNANYTESGIDKGYVSLFAISVYTKAQWTAVQAEEGIKPTMATQNTNYVIAYSLPNGTRPEDVEARAAEVKQIIATLKFN